MSSVATRVIPYFYNKTTDMPKQKNIDELVENEITGTAKELRKALTTVKAPASNKSKLLSSGFAPLNLASTNCHHGFIAPGEDCIIFGDSASGKTWLYLQILAEAANNPNFDEYRLIVDNSENGIGMDIERFFGKKLAERLEPPSYDSNDEPFNSETVEDFYYHLDDALKQKMPFIYVMDSITSLSSVADDDKFDENKKIHLDNRNKGTDKDLSGSYGMAIAKAHSQNTRRVVAGLRKTGSILIRVAQSRDNVTGYGASKTYAGGRALKFYSHLEIQTSVASQIKKTHNDRMRVLGTICRIQILKNRHSGQRPEVLMPIYNQSGVDSVGGTLEWLIEEKIIAKEKGKQSLSIPALNLTGTFEKIVRTIEEEGREAELYEFAQQSWNEILQAVAVQRKQRYE